MEKTIRIRSSAGRRVMCHLGGGEAVRPCGGSAGIFLMGYGLVAIPRTLWRLGDVRGRHRLTCHKAGIQAQKALDAHKCAAAERALHARCYYRQHCKTTRVVRRHSQIRSFNAYNTLMQISVRPGAQNC